MAMATAVAHKKKDNTVIHVMSESLNPIQCLDLTPPVTAYMVTLEQRSDWDIQV